MGFVPFRNSRNRTYYWQQNMEILTLIVFKWLDLAVFRVQNRPIWTKIHWKDILEGMVWTFNSSSGRVQKGECKKASVNFCDTPIVFQVDVNGE